MGRGERRAIVRQEVDVGSRVSGCDDLLLQRAVVLDLLGWLHADVERSASGQWGRLGPS